MTTGALNLINLPVVLWVEILSTLLHPNNLSKIDSSFCNVRELLGMFAHEYFTLTQKVKCNNETLK